MFVKKSSLCSKIMSFLYIFPNIGWVLPRVLRDLLKLLKYQQILLEIFLKLSKRAQTLEHTLVL